MKKRIFMILLMLLACTFSVCVFANAASEQNTFAIVAKSISLKDNVYVNFKVVLPENADVRTLRLLVWEGVPAEKSYTKETAGATVLTVAGKESDTGYYVFQYRDVAAKEMGKTLYARAYYEVGGEVIYTAPLRYSVAEYLYNMKTEDDTEFNDLLESLIAYGNAARAYFHMQGEEVGPEMAGMCTLTVEGGNFADGFTTGKFLVGDQVTLVGSEYWHVRANNSTTPVQVEGSTVTVNANATYTACTPNAVSSYNWSNDYSTCTASRACTSCGQAAVTETVNTTCTNGLISASFRTAGFETQTYCVELKGVTVGALGDSYFAGPEIQPEEVWLNLLADKYDMTMKINAVSGATVADARASRVPNCAPSRYNTMPTDADIILLEGGRNDFNLPVKDSTLPSQYTQVPIGEKGSRDTTTFIGAWNVIIDAVQERCPNAMIVLISPWNFPNSSSRPIQRETYVNAMKEVAKEQGVYFIDATDTSLVGVNMQDASFRAKYSIADNDVSHLNAKGMAFVMPKFEKILAQYYTEFLAKKS